jgi:hypothetical protein
MGRKPAAMIIRRTDVNVAIAELKKVNVPQSAAVSLRSRRSSGRHPSPVGLGWRATQSPRAKGGGAGGIRTLDRALQPYNGLANRRLQPLGHSSVVADMPDTGASRKLQFLSAEFFAVWAQRDVGSGSRSVMACYLCNILPKTAARQLPKLSLCCVCKELRFL